MAWKLYRKGIELGRSYVHHSEQSHLYLYRCSYCRNAWTNDDQTEKVVDDIGYLQVSSATYHDAVVQALEKMEKKRAAIQTALEIPASEHSALLKDPTAFKAFVKLFAKLTWDSLIEASCKEIRVRGSTVFQCSARCFIDNP